MATLTTYKEIQDSTLGLLNRSDSTARNRIKDWINAGQRDFVLRELWPFREATDTITTVGGTQEYTLSSETADLDAANIISVAIQGANESKLTYMPFNQLRASNPDLDAAGQSVPTIWYIKGGNIGFWPTPAAAYSIAVDYYKIPTELSADADVSIIPLAYREALMHYALSLEHDFNTDPDLSIKAMNRYEEIVTLARNNLLAQPSTEDSFRISGPADFRNHTGLSEEVV